MGAKLGILEALADAEPHVTPQKRKELLEEMMRFQHTQDPYPVVHLLISLMGGDSKQLILIPERERKQEVYLALADELEQHAATLSTDNQERTAEYLTGYAKYFRDMPPIIKGEPLSADASRIAGEWEREESTYTDTEKAAVRDQLHALAQRTVNIHVKTTLLMNWVFMARDIDWSKVASERERLLPKSGTSDQSDDMFNRLLGSLLRKVGLGIVDSHDTVKRLLDEHLEGGAASVDSDAFVRLCGLTGPEVYAEIAQLVRAEKNLRNVSGKKPEEDKKLKAIREQTLHRLAARDGAMEEAAKHVQKREGFRSKLMRAGLDSDEIEAQMNEYDRYVFEALRNDR
jgi:hypothetical protein